MNAQFPGSLLSLFNPNGIGINEDFIDPGNQTFGIADAGRVHIVLADLRGNRNFAKLKVGRKSSGNAGINNGVHAELQNHRLSANRSKYFADAAHCGDNICTVQFSAVKINARNSGDGHVLKPSF